MLEEFQSFQRDIKEQDEARILNTSYNDVQKNQSIVIVYIQTIIGNPSSKTAILIQILPGIFILLFVMGSVFLVRKHRKKAAWGTWILIFINIIVTKKSVIKSSILRNKDHATASGGTRKASRKMASDGQYHLCYQRIKNNHHRPYL